MHRSRQDRAFLKYPELLEPCDAVAVIVLLVLTVLLEVSPLLSPNSARPSLIVLNQKTQ